MPLKLLWDGAFISLHVVHRIQAKAHKNECISYSSVKSSIAWRTTFFYPYFVALSSFVFSRRIVCNVTVKINTFYFQ